MIKASLAATILVAAFTCTPSAASDWVEHAAAAAEARAKAEARWVRAERDRANAILARDFAPGQPLKDTHAAAADEHPAAVPEVSH
jgi:hypothetical protein